MTSHYTDALGNRANRYIDDLTVTHPIGFKYADAVTARNGNADTQLPELVAANQGFLKNAPTASFDTKLAARVGLPKTTKTIENTLYNGYMTCASCHEVHNTLNASPEAGSSPYNYFLYAKEEGSAICLSCHIK